MTHQPPLFDELAFNKENVLSWAEEQVLGEPVIKVDGKDVANSTDHVLRSVLLTHYVRSWSELHKGELIDELHNYVKSGVENPLDEMSTTMVLEEIMEVCKDAYEFESMDDFVFEFGGS
jgi:hypothetical protein